MQTCSIRIPAMAKILLEKKAKENRITQTEAISNAIHLYTQVNKSSEKINPLLQYFGSLSEKSATKMKEAISIKDSKPISKIFD